MADLSGEYQFFSTFGELETELVDEDTILFQNDLFVANSAVGEFQRSFGDAIEICDEVYEVLRIEKGIPKYGVDMDEETVVPEVNLEDMISYQKGCYIGQEVIAR
ncbi:MAG: aminomethyl transferase family protein, partial [Acidobacteria bacterium]|nr:aminomethyl transferase family protein [Acidobacteriota bacterium]